MGVVKRFSWVASFILIIGCSHSIPVTKPNTTYLSNIPSIAQFLPSMETKKIEKTIANQEKKVHQLFERIFQFDQQLAIELGRIPEFQDGVNEREVFALHNIMNFLSVSTDNEKRAFKEILIVGRPEYRKFCSPLQGLFWLAEKGEFIKEKNPLENYSLEKLLNRAWAPEAMYTKEEAINIINNLKDKEMAKRILNEWGNDSEAVSRTFSSLRKLGPKKFFEDKNIFKKYKGFDRWSDVNAVMDRLNSPELFEYWFWLNFTYDWSKFSITTPTAYPQTAEFTIKTKKGICFDAAYLAYVCLKRAGYDVTGLNVYFRGRTSVGAIMHSVCILRRQDSDKIRYYKIADTNSAGDISRPFDSIREIAEHVALMCLVQLKIYTTGLPSYDYNLWR